MRAAELMTRAEAVLKHPMGKRTADLYLAQAAVHGHLGRRAWAAQTGSKTALMTAKQKAPTLDGGRLKNGIPAGIQTHGPRDAFKALLARLRRKRTWYLPLTEQIDQGQTPTCVCATGQEWERCEPMRTHDSLGFMELYRRCKMKDGDSEDGTWASTLLSVYEELGQVASSWWWTGPADDAAIDEWLLNIGPLWWGAYWSESMFRTVDHDGDAYVECVGAKQWGHEVLILATDRKRGARLIQNHWGRTNWGEDGRAWILDADFTDHLHNGGADLFGVVQHKRAA